MSPPPAPTAARPLRVVGIGADGWQGVPERHRRMILEAATVLGGARHLAMLPTATHQLRLPWPSPLRAGLPGLVAGLPDGPVVALASGDPLVSGVGSTLIELFGANAVTIVPAVSSVALARAAMGWPAESCAVVSVVGREPTLVARQIAPGRRVLVLSADEGTPELLAHLLVGAGFGASQMTVLGDLGTDQETRIEGRAMDWRAMSPRLNIVALSLVGPHRGGWVAGLPDEYFEHDGQITKRDLRASALARLAPTPGEHLWDVGAGAGSVGIEWMRAHRTCTTTAIEQDDSRAQRIARNAAALGVPGLNVVTGRAPDALADQRPPHAIFVGGGANVPGVIEACLGSLPRDGRLVVHGVTLETEQVLAAAYRAHGGELTRIAVETAAPLGSLTGWTPARAVTQWFLVR